LPKNNINYFKFFKNYSFILKDNFELNNDPISNDFELINNQFNTNYYVSFFADQFDEEYFFIVLDSDNPETDAFEIETDSFNNEEYEFDSQINLISYKFIKPNNFPFFEMNTLIKLNLKNKFSLFFKFFSFFFVFFSTFFFKIFKK